MMSSSCMQGGNAGQEIGSEAATGTNVSLRTGNIIQLHQEIPCMKYIVAQYPLPSGIEKK